MIIYRNSFTHYFSDSFHVPKMPNELTSFWMYFKQKLQAADFLSMCPPPTKEARFVSGTLLPWGGGGAENSRLESRSERYWAMYPPPSENSGWMDLFKIPVDLIHMDDYPANSCAMSSAFLLNDVM